MLPSIPAGCLPSLATIPIFIGLFRSLQDFASQEEAGSAGELGPCGSAEAFFSSWVQMPACYT